jgi:peptide/nickel transport system permease protein
VDAALMRVAAFFVRRFARGILTLLTLILVAFAMYWAIPSSPERFIYGDQMAHGVALTPAQIHRSRHFFGLDHSKPVQYVDYVWQIAHGDLGRHWSGSRELAGKLELGTPIAPDVLPPLRVTLSIALGGALIVLLLALPLGAIAGTHIGTWTDRAISFFALLCVCTHPMMIGLILGSAARRLEWYPTGYCPLFQGPTDQCGGLTAWSSHLVLPWLTFALLFLALYTRMVRASVAETVHEDYVRTARAKGASEARVVALHVLPSASLRVLTMVGMEIGTAIGVSIYIEAAFRFHGLGQVAVFAIGGGADVLDLPYLLAIVTVIAIVVVVGNLVVDLLYGFLDPRAGSEGSDTRTKSLVGGVF